MGRDASHPRRRLSDPMRDPEAPRRPPSHAIPTDDHPTTRWSLPSDSSVPFLDLAHRVPPTVSSLALDRELEMDLEASDNTLRRHEEAALRVSEHQNPFGASRLQPFHEMSEHAIARAIELCRARLASRNKPLSADAQAATKTKPPTRAQEDAQWKLVKEHADIRVYRHVKRRGKTTAMMAQGMVRGSLAEIMDGLYAETTKEARVLYPLLSGSFLDVAVLHVDSYRTAQHPFQFAGVTWMAFETPRGGYGMCKDRDFVCFKKMGLLKDPESSAGDDIGFLTILSVDQREASTANSDSSAHFSSPSSPAEYVRGFLSLTAFFKKLPNGLVSMFVSGDFNARGRLAMRLADHMFADLVFALGNAATCGQAKSLAMLLQSITGGQMPPNGVGGGLLTASVSGSHVSHLLPLISDKHRDRCGVCAKSLWRVIKRPEFCRSCWTRTCRNCHVTMPIYCADFHRAHDEDGFGTNGPTKRKYKRLPRPCKETFCLKCVCSVLPNGIKMNAKLLQQTAKKRKYHKKHGGGGSISLGTDASLLRRGMGRTAASARHVPSVIPSFESHSSHRNGNGKSGGSIGGGSSRNGREPGKLYVQISRPHHMRSRGGTPSNGGNGASGADSVARAAQPLRVPYHHRFDDQSSISVLSSVESEKLQRQRLSLNKVNAKQLSSIATTPQRPPSDSVSLKQPSSMLEVIEHFQQTQKTAALSADYSEPLNDYMDDDGGLTYNSYTSLSGDVAIYPSDRSQSAVNSSAPTSRKLQLRVNLTPRKRSRRSSTASSSLGGYSQTSSKRTNAASSMRQSPQLSSHPAPFDDAYYNLALQRYLEHRRSSLRTMSSTMSGNPFESLDKAAAEATALAIASSSERGKIGGYAAVASTSMSTSSGSMRGPVGRDAHKLRILRDLEPFPRTASFLDRPLTPSGVSLSSLSSWDSSSSSGTSGSVAEEAARSGRVDYPEHKRSKREWTPRAY